MPSSDDALYKFHTDPGLESDARRFISTRGREGLDRLRGGAKHDRQRGTIPIIIDIDHYACARSRCLVLLDLVEAF